MIQSGEFLDESLYVFLLRDQYLQLITADLFSWLWDLLHKGL